MYSNAVRSNAKNTNRLATKSLASRNGERADFKFEDNRQEANNQRITQNAINGAVIQRKIAVGNEWFSFQNLYDDRGNPYLLGHTSDKKKKLSVIQNSIGLEDAGSDYLPLKPETKENVFRNLGYGRPMNLGAPSGEKSRFLPFKDYKFKPTSPFDIAVFSPSDKKGELYSDFNTKMESNLNTNLDNVTKVSNPVLDNMETVKNEMETLIYAEEFRTSGVQKVFESEYGKARKEIEQETKNYQSTNDKNKKSQSKTKIKKQMKRVTTDLPWAGTGGKEKFRKSIREKKWDTVLSEKDKKPVVTTGNWFGIKSPLREDEDEDPRKYKKRKNEKE